MEPLALFEEAKVQHLALSHELATNDTWERAAFDVWEALLFDQARAIEEGDSFRALRLSREMAALRQRWLSKDSLENRAHAEIIEPYGAIENAGSGCLPAGASPRRRGLSRKTAVAAAASDQS